MSVLGEWDIIKKLGGDILFHPLKPHSLRICRLCLTASEYAYSINQQKRLAIETEAKQNEEHKLFYIPKGETALVWTDESIWLSNSLCGTVHSRVELVSKGIDHIGTTVNPN